MRIKITNNEAAEICRMGKGEECCAFLILSGEGFECCKIDSLGTYIFNRLREGTMTAKGRGGWKNCKCEGV